MSDDSKKVSRSRRVATGGSSATSGRRSLRSLRPRWLGRGDRGQSERDPNEGAEKYRIPEQPIAIVGRAEDVEGAAAVLLNPATRLITLVGPAGVGKTRLA